mgnify:CR=1 FL=1
MFSCRNFRNDTSVFLVNGYLSCNKDGNKIIITHFNDNSIEVEDFGRGCPVDYNNNEKRYNWELVYCELYAGGKYDDSAESYEYSLGLNGLGLCATQFSSEFMDVEVIRDGFRYNLHFEKGENVGGLKKEACRKKQTGTKTRWRPDLDVFTDINIPLSYFQDTLKRQSVVNANIKFILRDEQSRGFDTYEYIYENGHRAHCTSRQIGGCDNEHCIMVYGTKGYTNCNDTIFNLDGSIAWKYPKPEKDDADQSMAVPNPYMEEHVRLVRAIRENKPVNDIEKHVQSVMIALMGRMAAYTGKFVTWDDVLASKMDLVPAKMEFGPVEGVTEEFPLPGVEYKV